ncbi:ATP synthase subunit C lysine N-methyltransferase isoform X2 [Ranitomeya variabilis]|uniref:ATP synthase subunit C lysine N-methyltransferase isoform X2 n=1 Tax=Ranitomeya variabilis TaxID=490064 RepID=UPI004056E1E2
MAEEPSLKYNIGTEKNKTWGLVATGVVGGTLVALYAVATPFVSPALRKICLPFVPATELQMENIFKMLMFRSGTFVDLGSGDGRIVIAAAKKGFQAVGYELNPWLVWYSRYNAWKEGVHQNTKFHISDLWKVPERDEDIIDNDILISLVHARVPLWDTRVPPDSDNMTIRRLWNEEAKAMWDGWDNAPTRVRTAFLLKVKTRWRSMKDRFNKESRVPKSSREPCSQWFWSKDPKHMEQHC